MHEPRLGVEFAIYLRSHSSAHTSLYCPYLSLLTHTVNTFTTTILRSNVDYRLCSPIALHLLAPHIYLDWHCPLVLHLPQRTLSAARLQDYYYLKHAAPTDAHDRLLLDSVQESGELDRPDFDAQSYIQSLLAKIPRLRECAWGGEDGAHLCFLVKIHF